MPIHVRVLTWLTTRCLFSSLKKDLDQVLTGKLCDQSHLLPDPDYQGPALAGIDTLVSTRLDPGIDPITEADRRGSILAIIRWVTKILKCPALRISQVQVWAVWVAEFRDCRWHSHQAMTEGVDLMEVVEPVEVAERAVVAVDLMVQASTVPARCHRCCQAWLLVSLHSITACLSVAHRLDCLAHHTSRWDISQLEEAYDQELHPHEYSKACGQHQDRRSSSSRHELSNPVSAFT